MALPCCHAWGQAHLQQQALIVPDEVKPAPGAVREAQRARGQPLHAGFGVRRVVHRDGVAVAVGQAAKGQAPLAWLRGGKLLAQAVGGFKRVAAVFVVREGELLARIEVRLATLQRGQLHAPALGVVIVDGAKHQRQLDGQRHAPAPAQPAGAPVAGAVEALPLQRNQARQREVGLAHDLHAGGEDHGVTGAQLAHGAGHMALVHIVLNGALGVGVDAVVVAGGDFVDSFLGQLGSLAQHKADRDGRYTVGDDLRDLIELGVGQWRGEQLLHFAGQGRDFRGGLRGCSAAHHGVHARDQLAHELQRGAHEHGRIGQGVTQRRQLTHEGVWEFLQNLLRQLAVGLGQHLYRQLGGPARVNDHRVGLGAVKRAHAGAAFELGVAAVGDGLGRAADHARAHTRHADDFVGRGRVRLESAARHRHRVAVDLQGRGAVLQARAVRHVQHRRHTTTFQIDRVRRRGNDRLHPTLVDRPAIIDVRGHEIRLRFSGFAHPMCVTTCTPRRRFVRPDRSRSAAQRDQQCFAAPSDGDEFAASREKD